VAAQILYLASTNRGKLRELEAAAAASGIVVEPYPALQSLPACDEDGLTFEDNARKKAIHYSAYFGGLVLADDSGIAVDALGGAPGVRSARFAGPHADDRANNRRLLDELRGVPPGRRTARYVCVLVVARRGGVLTVSGGLADGVVLESPQGSGGFGYDPLFYYPPGGKTFAEMAAAEKLAVSHRGNAFRRLVVEMRNEWARVAESSGQQK